MSSSSLNNEVGAYEQERLEELSQRPNTTVFKAEYESTHEPWKADRLRKVCEHLARRVLEFEEGCSDFKVRKVCMSEDEEVLQFQRSHPKLFWMVTDRKMVTDDRFKMALAAMFRVREQVEKGKLQDGRDADAMATTGIMSALKSQ